MSKSRNTFEAARKIADILKDFDSENRQKIIRWAMEELNDSVQTINPRNTTLPITPESVIRQKTSTQDQTLSNLVDIKLFVNSKDPKNDTQLATTIAYYYAFKAPNNDRKDSIGAKDFLEAIRLLNRKRPSSKPLQVLSNAKNLGYLDPTGERGQFKINSVGENLVAMVLPDKVHKKANLKKKKVKKKKVKKKSTKRTEKRMQKKGTRK